MSEPNDLSDLPHEVARAVELLFDRKAVDVTLLDLRKVSTATDFFVIATGRSDTHVSAIGDHLVDELKKRALSHDMRLGNGYGPWARNTFRIANFPAILDEEYEELKRFFLHYYA